MFCSSFCDAVSACAEVLRALYRGATSSLLYIALTPNLWFCLYCLSVCKLQETYQDGDCIRSSLWGAENKWSVSNLVVTWLSDLLFHIAQGAWQRTFLTQHCTQNNMVPWTLPSGDTRTFVSKLKRNVTADSIQCCPLSRSQPLKDIPNLSMEIECSLL
jgi:hypothetical protein